jgi:hypothetical protein
MTDANTSTKWLGNSARAAEEDAPLSRAREKARQHAVNVAILIYLIMIFDGVIRKYLLPELQRPLVFLRDPFILYLYAYAIVHGFIRQSLFLVTGFILLVLTAFLILPNSLSGSDAIIFALFGLRQYFFPILLPFVIGAIFHHEDMQRFFRINLILMIVMAPLMVLQVLSPADSVVNVGGSLNPDLAFGNNGFGDYVRAPGFFTGALPLDVFLPLIGAILLFTWIARANERPCSSFTFAASLVALMVAIAMSGSRGAILALIMLGIGAMMLTLLMPGARSGRAFIATCLIAVCAFVSFVFVFPDQFAALSERWGGSNLDQGQGYLSIVYRMIDTVSDFTAVIPNTPPLGFGLGMGSNAATILIASPTGSFADIQSLIENDWSRHIVDLGPLIGVLYIFFRIALTARLGLIGLASAHRDCDPRPWLLFLAVGPQMFNGTIAGQTTMNGLIWFYAGLIIAAPLYRRSFR